MRIPEDDRNLHVVPPELDREEENLLLAALLSGITIGLLLGAAIIGLAWWLT